MSDIRPHTFHHVLYLFYSVMTCFGLFIGVMQAILILNKFDNDFMGIHIPYQYSFVLIIIAGVCSYFAYRISKQHRKLYEETKWRN